MQRGNKMPKINPYPTGPQTENRFATKEAAQANKRIIDQANLNATIKRVKNIRSKFDAVVEEGTRVGKSIEEKAQSFEARASQRAEEIQTKVSQGVSRVQEASSQKISYGVSLIEARNTAGVSPESGKGNKVSAEA